MDEAKTLRVQDLARLLGVSAGLIYREAKLGRITHYKVGKTVRIPVEAAQEYIRRVRVEASQSN
jgi:excisionase family DNA binding protein